MFSDTLYLQRDRISASSTLAAALACALVVTLMMKRHPPVPLPPPEKPLTITLTALTEPVAPVVAKPAPKQPEPPQKVVPRTEPKPRPPEKTATPKTHTVTPTPVTPSASPAPSAHSAEPAEAPTSSTPTPQARVAPPAPTSATPPLPKGNSDHTYEASVLALVEAHKMYPTGRQAMLDHPQGTVRVCVSLSRNGEAGDVRIAGTSGAMLLDQAARRLVSGLTYPPFPAQSFQGQDRHEFCMSVDYQSPDS
jgi:protein TonB